MDRAVLDRLIPLVYAELQRLARSYLKSERQDHTLQTTALVHEAYLRLAQQHNDLGSPEQVLGVAARQMRRILVDHARARGRQKRSGAGFAITTCGNTPNDVDVLALDRALDALEQMDERQTQIVELRYFGGLTVEETASVLSVSPATVFREWAMARAWLRNKLANGDAYET